jgi:hypothetical protein
MIAYNRSWKIFRQQGLGVSFVILIKLTLVMFEDYIESRKRERKKRSYGEISRKTQEEELLVEQDLKN